VDIESRLFIEWGWMEPAASCQLSLKEINVDSCYISTPTPSSDLTFSASVSIPSFSQRPRYYYHDAFAKARRNVLTFCHPNLPRFFENGRQCQYMAHANDSCY